MDSNYINDILVTENNIENLQLFYLLSDGNPDVCVVLTELIKNIDHIILKDFFTKIWYHAIIGARLWYIYENECNRNINELVEKDLTPFNRSYFIEKFEKYI